jgi:alanine-glyoxylate transaminase/serine-glyoxylate transaminase/serine-pyruvate transaminase
MDPATSPPMKLMIPGPVELEDEVLQALAEPVRPHYGPEWASLHRETVDMLRQVYHTSGDVFVLVGSGSSALDACLGSSLASGEPVLIGVNGWFGERLAAIAEQYGLEVIPVPAPWGEPLDPSDFDRAFERHPEARLAAVVHLETSTTIVNPVEAIARLATRHGRVLMVDAVSSLGGLPIHMDDWGIGLCVSASQKCLGGPPGLATVAVNPDAWSLIDRAAGAGHGWYLNLRVWRQYATEWADWHPFPITMATSNVVALHVGLRRLLAEGQENRTSRFRRLALRLRRGLRQIGMTPFTSDDLLAPVLTAAYGPAGVPTSDIVRFMSDRHHTKIAGGLGEPLVDKIFRIGHMSPVVSEADIDAVVEQLGAYRPGWSDEPRSPTEPAARSG